jgi:multiple antibiotic resistance protein
MDLILNSTHVSIVQTFIGLIAIVNPVGAIPIFLSLTAEKSRKERHRIARVTALAVALVLVLSAWLGESLLEFFGIGIPSFRVGGGLLIVLMAVAMLHARMSPIRHTDEEADEAANQKEDVAVVPLAIPLMAGPGAISLVIVDAHQGVGWVALLSLTLIVIVLALTIYVVLHFSENLGDLLGITGLNIATRVMGLILAAIGVQFIADGLKVLFPVLVGAS